MKRRLLVILATLLSPVQSIADTPHLEQKASQSDACEIPGRPKIEFPDFIEYVGERRKSLPVYPRGFLYRFHSQQRKG
jgi:hypothetical protein